MKWLRQVYWLIRVVPVLIKTVRYAWSSGRDDVAFARQRVKYERDNSGDGILPIDDVGGKK